MTFRKHSKMPLSPKYTIIVKRAFRGKKQVKQITKHCIKCTCCQDAVRQLQKSTLANLQLLLFTVFTFGCMDLHCCVWAFSSCGEWGLLSMQRVGLSLQWLLLLRSTGSRVHRLQELVVVHELQRVDSVVVAHGLSFPMTYGIFLDQVLNPCPLRWQADS